MKLIQSIQSRINKRLEKFARKNQIYIIPTAYGAIFLFSIVFILFAGAIYSNNLVNLLSFFLASIAIVSMVQTHDNLKGVKLKMIRASSGFAESFITVETTLENPTKSTRFNLEVRLPDLEFYEEIEDSIPISAFARNRFQGVYRSKSRGVYTISKIRISSIYPLGLFYAWTYVDTKTQYFVYPKASGRQNLPQDSLEGERSRLSHNHGDDFSGHRSFQKADSPSRIDWKAYARGRGIHIKEFKSGASKSLLLDFGQCSQDQTEARLEQISQWIEICRKKEIPFALKLPDHFLPTGMGVRHVKRSLEELAKYKSEAS